jgi:uncharacterized membrane-anchored protein YhcB (DUF1043 family)
VNDEDWIDFFDALGVTAWRAFLACLVVALIVGYVLGKLT